MESNLRIIKSKSIYYFLKNKNLILIIFASLLLRLIWMQIPVVIDEGSLGYIAMQWSEGFPPYEYSLDNKGPLAYILYLIPIELFGNSIFPIRILNNFLFLASVILLYTFVKNWYGDKIASISSILFAFFMNIPIFGGQLVTAITLSSPFIIFSVFFCQKYIDREKPIWLLLSGISFSFNVLILWPNIVALILPVYILASHAHKKSANFNSKLRFFLRDFLLLILSVLVFPLIFAYYFWTKGILTKMIYVMITRSLELFSSPSVSFPDVPFGHTFLILTEGLPLLIFGFFGIYYIFIFRKFNAKNIFILIWLFVLLIPALWAVPRFGHRFLLTIVPFSILAGISINALMSSFAKDYNSNSQKLISIFAIFILLSSFIPLIIMTEKQFPNFNIHWQFVDWDWSFSENYDQQQEIISFISSDLGKQDNILFHGWFPELYFLSGKSAPSIYVFSYRGDGVDITDAEYNRVLNLVKQREFKYVVFLSWFPDQIMDATRQKYELVKVIGRGRYIYEIYKNSRSLNLNSSVLTQGKDYNNFNFIDNLSHAKKILEISDTLKDAQKDTITYPVESKLNINGENRRTILQHPENVENGKSNICYDNITINHNSMLKFGIAIDPSVWDKSGDGVLYEIFIKGRNLTNVPTIKYKPKEIIDDSTKWNKLTPLVPNFKINYAIDGWWRRHDGGSYNNTISYSNLKGIKADIGFTGNQIDLLYIKEPNGGIADIKLDELKYPSIDMYSPNWQFQQVYSIDSLSDGRHNLTIEVSGKNRGNFTAIFVGNGLRLTRKNIIVSYVFQPELFAQTQGQSSWTKEEENNWLAQWVNVQLHPERYNLELPQPIGTERIAELNTISNKLNASNVTVNLPVAGDFYVFIDALKIYQAYTDPDAYQIIKIFSQYINPKANESERKWNDFELNLNENSGKNVSICFVTELGPNGDVSYDWAHWSEPQLIEKELVKNNE